MPHIPSVNCVGIGSYNGLSPVWRQAFIWTNAGLLSIRTLGTIFSEILIKIQKFSFMKMHLKISSAKLRPFCPRGDELTHWSLTKWLTLWRRHILSSLPISAFQFEYHWNLFIFNIKSALVVLLTWGRTCDTPLPKPIIDYSQVLL